MARISGKLYAFSRSQPDLRRLNEEEQPLRSVLFGPVQLSNHARLLGSTHELDSRPPKERLLKRLKQNEQVIRESYLVVSQAAREGRRAGPAAEWLLDNAYLIEDHILLAREHLPARYSKQLPTLMSGDRRGYPRVYDIALELVSHTDGRIEMENLSQFIKAYQEESRLKIGELWAVPIMLRLALLEDLRRVSARVAQRLNDQLAAAAWVERFFKVVPQGPRQLINVLSDFMKSHEQMSQAFIAELETSLQGQHPSLSLVTDVIEHELAELGQTIEQVMQSESNDQAADQVSIGNSVTSLRNLAAMDWRKFVEEQSVIEEILRRDPAGVYPQMDFHTRDRYRHIVEILARRSLLDEQNVARKVLMLAEDRAGGATANEPEVHVGYFLADKGRADLESNIQYSRPLHRKVGRWMERHSLALYFLARTALTLLLIAVILFPHNGSIFQSGRISAWHGTIMLFLLVIFASQPASFIINWLITLFVPPRWLPKMDFERGIPPQHRTAVAVPCILHTRHDAHQLVEDLETRYLSNRQKNLLFVLLSDFADASVRHLPDDSVILKRAMSGIRRLNEKYSEPGQDIFFLMHREREWNPTERAWMGFERKRGKLAAFARFLRDGALNGFSTTQGDLSCLRDISYIISLDSDSQLPPGVAGKMVGAMAHPLNRPRIDPSDSCVKKGYGILQPATAIGLETAGKSLFARLFAGDVGIDPYTREISDVLHDVFGRTRYIGKGILDVKAFDISLRERFPRNRILSHDLIEGCYARCGFLDDVGIVEGHPINYASEVSRRQRWVRGDWQIASWLLPFVRGEEGKKLRNPLDMFSRWLIFDNLRRSLAPAAMFALLVISWLMLEHSEILTLTVLFIYLLPDVMRILHGMMTKSSKSIWTDHMRRIGLSQGKQILINLLRIALLPYEASFHLDAAWVACWRVLITRRKLLQWETADNSDRHSHTSFVRFLEMMWVSPLSGIAIGLGIYFMQPSSLPAALPFLATWFIAPGLAWYISRPLVYLPYRFPDKDIQFLRKTARRTWAYFDEYVAPERNFLPPDNFQEHPVGRIAERTSPTNIGMALLSSLAAYDFGYVPMTELFRRISGTFGTLEKLRRYRGHFYNWYETTTLEPLHPYYISTVDSGNLACCLIALRKGLEDAPEFPVVSNRWREGLYDCVSVLISEAERSLDTLNNSMAKSETRMLMGSLRTAIEFLEGDSRSLSGTATRLAQLRKMLDEVVHLTSHDSEVVYWYGALRRQVDALENDLFDSAPWLVDGTTPPLPPGVAGEVEAIRAEINQVCSVRAMAGIKQRISTHLDHISSADLNPTARDWLHALQLKIELGAQRATERIWQGDELASRAGDLADYDFSFLYDSSRKLMSIGYSIDSHRLDTSYYDLLASEAQLASFMGVAQGKLPEEHWFMLSRQLAPPGGAPTLTSWSGSMFEYLMPKLFLESYRWTLLDQMHRGAVQRQIQYGRRRRVPWGMSESAYNQVDALMNYQYRAFGVPDLGLKRGLADDLVVAPYATVMALMVSPEESCSNLRTLARQGLLRRYGFYEAVDYTRGRVPVDAHSAPVRCFMAHHSGMSFLSLAHVLLDYPMKRRFMADPEMRATAMLLQERAPLARAAVRPVRMQLAPAEGISVAEIAAPVVRIHKKPDVSVPEVHLLSNGRYHVMITNAGSGFSRWKELGLTRWREDLTQDCWGMYFYLQDVESGEKWSCTYQPMMPNTEQYAAIFSQARAEFRMVYNQMESHIQMSVSPEDDTELRRITLTNLSSEARTIELTSFAEVVLNGPRAERAHPAFNNLFIQTELDISRSTVFCVRRPSSREEDHPWMFHFLAVRGPQNDAPASFETDRAKFMGRCRTAANPAVMDSPGPLSNSEGFVLDPCIAVRRRLVIGPDEVVVIDAFTGIAPNREAALTLVDRYQDRLLGDRIFELATSNSQVLLHQLHANEADAQLFARLSGSIFYANPRHRAAANIITRNRKSQSDLWPHGISGDFPIVLAQISDTSGLALARQMLQAHGYWRHKGLQTDLVLWADAFVGYRQSLVDQLVGLVQTSSESKLIGQHGGVYICSAEHFTADDHLLLQALARVVVTDRAGALEGQMERRSRSKAELPEFRRTRRAEPETPVEPLPRSLEFNNGIGGFTPDGKEYVIRVSGETPPPAPWSNVLANDRIGAVVTESGGGYTWFDNAHECRLTPWYNDPLTDRRGEVIYIRDEETGKFWSATAQPAGRRGIYLCRHGLGYSVFEHTRQGIFSELTVYVAVEAPIKFYSLKLRNLSDRERHISATCFLELVLGEHRDTHAMHVVTRVDPQTGAIFAFNSFRSEFRDRLAFLQCSEQDRTFTSDRRMFIGRNRSLSSPAAMQRQHLSNQVGAGHDPCAAIQAHITIPPGQERVVVFTLGGAESEGEARGHMSRFSSADGAWQALEDVWSAWDRRLGSIYVETPRPEVNFLANRWLLYQTLASRILGRSGYYQSGGAFGFRDQLQDVLACLHSIPDLARNHLLRAAGHQFHEGDVQHWWHPPSGRGVRTRCSDDYLWLPYVASAYVRTTGDFSILDEQVHFIEGRSLAPDEESYYDLPAASDEHATLYEHCVRALKYGFKFGAHGLPLIGSGDWNDGFNRVGLQGKGESVWLAFFLHDVLRSFEPIARQRHDDEFADKCSSVTETLMTNIELHAWDGDWYRRAYFDNGGALGTKDALECQIDSIPQSWAVLSGASKPERAEKAMDSVLRMLVDKDSSLIRLFRPPIDKMQDDPGYIQGYAPGVRENGGQYTHAAVWYILAWAKMLQPEVAWKLFDLINPIRHGDTMDAIERYKVEPYILAADVYTAANHEGRGGWTWYTGSAGWMYRLIVEALLGIAREGNLLTLRPVVPQEWGHYDIHYRFGGSVYHITIFIQGPETWNIRRIVLDDVEITPPSIMLSDDGRDHACRVEVG